MKLIINACYGGFGINKKWEAENCEKDCRECAIEKRENVDDNFSKLTVVEFPDEATDYELLEYDGKIRYA